jgi:hypothetical protein
MERSSFEIFKSNICHLVKDKGELSFIRDMLCSDEVSKLYERKWYAECLYLLAMIDYLSRKNDIPLYNRYDKLRTDKLDKVLYPSGIMAMYSLSGDESILIKSFDESIPEFKRFNIVENEIENVV